MTMPPASLRNPFEKLQVQQLEADWSVSRKGTIIEQSQILTTQNLSPLFAVLHLRSTLSGRLRELSERCFRWICKKQISCAAACRAGNLYGVGAY